MRIPYDKLIRDRVPEIMDAAGVRYEVETVEGEACGRVLRDKVVEEALEVQAAESRAELVKELADLQEVVAALLAASGVTADEVENERARRRQERGAFERGLILRWTELKAEP